MSEDIQTNAPEEASAPLPTAGQLLKQAREASGLHIAALAVALKVPTRKLEALEADRYEDLSGITFVRALSSSVCRHLKIDPQPVLERLPQGERPALVKVDDGINTPFRKPGEMVTLSETWQKLRITVIAVVALLLGSVLIYSIPSAWFNRPVKPAETQVEVKPGVVTEPVQALSGPVAASQPVEVSGAASASVSQPVPGSVTPVASAPVAAAPVPVLAPAAAVALPATSPVGITKTVMTKQTITAPFAAFTAKPSAEVLLLEAKADSWVEVLDRDGQQLVRRVLKAGEKMPVSGMTPMNITIGNADKTVVSVRGKSFDLSKVSRENIARFSVN